GGLRQPMHASNYSDFTHQLKIDRPLATRRTYEVALKELVLLRTQSSKLFPTLLTPHPTPPSSKQG
ncbi:hypothetical protein, partial [Stenomitos frigidus]|uniref:hypothetical protein n=1 Tax=Stenomitos frigidus TaxID=1886765 RepID=UPI001C62B76F